MASVAALYSAGWVDAMRRQMYPASTTAEERRTTCTKLRHAHSNHVPAAIGKGDAVPSMMRETFLLPKDMTATGLIARMALVSARTRSGKSSRVPSAEDGVKL